MFFRTIFITSNAKNINNSLGGRLLTIQIPTLENKEKTNLPLNQISEEEYNDFYYYILEKQTTLLKNKEELIIEFVENIEDPLHISRKILKEILKENNISNNYLSNELCFNKENSEILKTLKEFYYDIINNFSFLNKQYDNGIRKEKEKIIIIKTENNYRAFEHLKRSLIETTILIKEETTDIKLTIDTKLLKKYINFEKETFLKSVLNFLK